MGISQCDIDFFLVVHSIAFADAFRVKNDVEPDNRQFINKIPAYETLYFSRDELEDS